MRDKIRSTSDANMEHAGEQNCTRVFRFRVAQVCSLSFQIKFGNAWQNPVNWPLRDMEMKSTSAAIFTFRREKSINFSLYKQGTDARRLHYFYGLLFKNKGWQCHQEWGGLSRRHRLNGSRGGCNISNTRGSVSSGYPNTEKRVENTTRSGVFLTKFEVFG